ncbi:Ctr copper transporter [Arabidopsis suecica]|uniref:Copper transport protein n=1 Tax=Arabidopsis suecica TaxID=45249 RepID=A0A8T1YPK3_ARASU|nr:Ctr copper transporter [Arabidopsis suecica]
MMMHMTFFWGKNTEVLFSGWLGTSSGMYALCLIFIFFLVVLIEWLDYFPLLRGTTGDSANRTAGLIQTAVYTICIGHAYLVVFTVLFTYLVMLAVMSFNAGVSHRRSCPWFHVVRKKRERDRMKENCVVRKRDKTKGIFIL